MFMSMCLHAAHDEDLLVGKDVRIGVLLGLESITKSPCGNACVRVYKSMNVCVYMYLYVCVCMPYADQFVQS